MEEVVRENSQSTIVCRQVQWSAAPRNFHWHENFEICQVLEKHCSFLVDGIRVDASAGDLIVFNEYVIHRFYIQEDHTRLRIIQFPTQSLLPVRSTIRPIKMHISHDEIMGIPGLEEKLNEILAMMESEGPLHIGQENSFLQSLVPPLYLLLMRHFADDGTGKTGSKERMEFFRIIEYVNQNFHGLHTTQDIARALFIPRARLSAVFAHYAGVSLKDYIHTLRIQKANSLLAQGHSITYAALESGFQSIRTFNSVYKRVTGQTPSDHVRS